MAAAVQAAQGIPGSSGHEGSGHDLADGRGSGGPVFFAAPMSSRPACLCCAMDAAEKSSVRPLGQRQIAPHAGIAQPRSIDLRKTFRRPMPPGAQAVSARRVNACGGMPVQATTRRKEVAHGCRRVHQANASRASASRERARLSGTFKLKQRCAQRRHPQMLDAGAPGQTRTGTSFLTAPSRQRVYQFRHRRVGRLEAGD